MLMYAFLLLFMGKMQEHAYEETSQAWHWALAYAVAVLLLNVLDSLLGAVLLAVLYGVYAWGYFALLRVVVDQLPLWVLVFIGGALLPILVMARIALVGMQAAPA